MTGEQLSGNEASDEPVASAVSFRNVRSSGRQVRSSWKSRFVDLLTVIVCFEVLIVYKLTYCEKFKQVI